jgi:general stress protein YciG
MPRTLTPKLKEHLVAIGKKGGVSTSEKKRLAAIENGKKGGRPKKQIPATA